jgi:integrase
MTKRKYKFRWRENGQHRQRTFSSRLHRDDFAAKIQLRREEPESVVTFGEFASDWLSRHCDQAETTKAESEGALARHLLPALGKVPLGRIRKPHLLELRATIRAKAGRSGEPIKAKTVNNVVGLCKRILQAAVELELISANPAAGLKPLTCERQAFDFWTAEERDRFLTFCRQADPAFAELVMVACHTGLRKGELAALRRYQLDFDQRLIRVDANFSAKLKTRFGRTKNGEVAFVRMNAPVYEALRSRLLSGAEQAVFDPTLFVDAYDRLQRRCRQFGMRPIRFHDLRHTCASTLVMAGVPLYTVQRIMRHKSIAMTERYAHLTPDYMADAMEAIVRQSVRPEGREEAKILELK